ncbi:MAG: PadR family transcriptional regulator [Actinomycetota bacterium]|nr:PadR family transcriptional regulator [Actinomycetota bacterium]
MTARFFRHRELHLVILAILAERPMHGYELMGELGQRFSPAYRASAGSVYPAIESLASEGLIRAERNADPTAYRLTPVGEAALGRRAKDLVKVQHRTGVNLGCAATVEAALTRLADIARVAARDGSPGAVERLLDHTTTQLTKKEIS